MSTDRRLLYIADPMCSWCYGFAPEIARVAQVFAELPVDPVLGGLRAYNTEVMDQALKDLLRHHWHEVASRSGQPFSETLLDRTDFIYDTEPACRAVVTVRALAPALAMPMLAALQTAFYAQSRDITRAQMITEVYADLARSRADAPRADEFATAFDSEPMRQATRADFSLVQGWGVRGFPTLLAVQGNQAQLIAAGYKPADLLIDRIKTAFDPA